MSKEKKSYFRKEEVDSKNVKSDFALLKQSESLKRRHESGEKFHHGETHSEESRAKMSASHKRRYAENPDAIEQQRQRTIKRFQDPEQKKKFKEVMSSPEVRKKISDATKGRTPPNKISREVWIERFKSVHGDKYDYSKFDIDNPIIICSIHDEFRQQMKDHWKGRGCRKCGYVVGAAKGGKTLTDRVSPKRLSQDDVIKQFRSVHGDKYDYSKVEYVNTNTKVIIICPIHGEFQQIPKTHKSGIGCQNCGFLKQSETKLRK